jgi:hypothetical protein
MIQDLLKKIIDVELVEKSPAHMESKGSYRVYIISPLNIILTKTNPLHILKPIFLFPSIYA